MPSSNWGGKSAAKWLYESLHLARPLRRILDVGPGMGTYAKFRQDGQHWIGVEAWAPYIEKFGLAKAYDEIIVEDVRFFDWSRAAPLDLVICGDVLEHMTREEAMAVVEKALSVSRIVHISLPLGHAPQGIVEGNPFEIHVEEEWTDAQALIAFPDCCLSVLESYIGVYVLTRNGKDRRFFHAAGRRMNEIIEETRNDRAPIDVRLHGSGD